MLEVEIKFRNADRVAVVAHLLEWGAVLTQDRADADLYFQAPDRDLKATGEAFRLRRVGPQNYLTYKGKKIDAETKTRPEIEVPLGDGDATADDATRLLVALGYVPVVTVRKKRRVYAFARDGFEFEACFDALDGIGEFVELEIVTPEERYADAKAALLRAADELGLKDVEPRSYLGLVIAARAAEGGAH
jgi:adenylate cyclase class 2